MDGRTVLFEIKLKATLEARDDLYYHPLALKKVRASMKDSCFYHPRTLIESFRKQTSLKRLSLFAQPHEQQQMENHPSTKNLLKY